jgi:hypothetical protein
MTCCGQKRAALRTRTPGTASSRPARVTAPPDPGPPSGAVVVEYRGDRPVLARLASGLVYAFSPGSRTRSVSAADAAELRRNPLFRLEERRSNGTDQEAARGAVGRASSRH